MDEDVAQDPQEDIATRDGSFDLSFNGRAVFLRVGPPAGDGVPVDVASVLTALRSTPLERFLSDHVAGIVREAKDAPVAIGEIHLESARGWELAVSPDKLGAYLVPATVPVVEPPPPDEGEPEAPPTAEATPAVDRELEALPAEPVVLLADSEAIRKEMAIQQITSGILEDALAAFDPPAPVHDIVLIARGETALPGQDAEIDITFDLDPDLKPITREDGTIDYHEAATARFVLEHVSLVVRHPPVNGTVGFDVHGQTLPPPLPKDRSLDSMVGPGTEIDGDTLIASFAGRPLLREGRIQVLAVYEVNGDLDFSVGNIDFVGEVIIRGDIKPGFAIHAGGSVTVRGTTEHATIVAGQDIVLGGVLGHGEIVLEAGGDITAQFIHNASVTAGGTVKVRNEIVGCRVTAKVIETSTSGRIVGGTLTAETLVSTGVLGSPKGAATEVTVTAHEGTARVKTRTEPGVILRIGSATLPVQDELPPSSFWDVGGTVIKLGPAVEEYAEDKETQVA